MCDRCLIDVDPNVLAIWNVSSLISWCLVKTRQNRNPTSSCSGGWWMLIQHFCQHNIYQPNLYQETTGDRFFCVAGSHLSFPFLDNVCCNRLSWLWLMHYQCACEHEVNQFWNMDAMYYTFSNIIKESVDGILLLKHNMMFLSLWHIFIWYSEYNQWLINMIKTKGRCVYLPRANSCCLEHNDYVISSNYPRSLMQGTCVRPANGRWRYIVT